MITVTGDFIEIQQFFLNKLLTPIKPKNRSSSTKDAKDTKGI